MLDDSDLLDDGDLDDLLDDEEPNTQDKKIKQEDISSTYENFKKSDLPTKLKTLEKPVTPIQGEDAHRKRGVTLTKGLNKRLDQFGFADSEKKQTLLQTTRKTMAVKPKNTPSAKIPSFKEGEVKVNQMQQMTDQQIQEGLPEFLLCDKKRDKDGKYMTDPEYDPTTLLVPHHYFSQCTATMKQYWSIKGANHDKVLLFKLGKFYEMFFEDAIVGQRVMDLNWMGGAKKYHVGFPEKALEKYVPILVNNGYKVAVVEQTETPRQMEKRQKDNRGPKPKCVARDLCNVYSKGTYFDANDGSYEPKWVLVFSNDFENNVGVAFFDLTTLKFYVGQFKDNQMFGKFRTLAMQLRPTEIIFDKSQALPELIKILMNSPVPPVKSGLAPKL